MRYFKDLLACALLFGCATAPSKDLAQDPFLRSYRSARMFIEVEGDRQGAAAAIQDPRALHLLLAETETACHPERQRSTKTHMASCMKIRAPDDR